MGYVSCTKQAFSLQVQSGGGVGASRQLNAFLPAMEHLTPTA